MFSRQYINHFNSTIITIQCTTHFIVNKQNIKYCEITFIRSYQFLWFEENSLVRGFILETK